MDTRDNRTIQKFKGTASAIIIAAAIILLAGVSEGLANRVYIDIDSPTFQRIPLAISEFQRQGQERLPSDEMIGWFPKELSRLLSITGIFNIQGRTPLADDRSRATLDLTRFTEWRLIGAEYLINGRLQQLGPELSVELRLYDLIKGELLVGKRYTGNPEDRKIMVQRFASEVLANFTGDGSVYDSKIAFVGRKGKTSAINVINFDGTNLSRIIEVPSLLLALKWSTDGTTIAFTSYQQDNPDLYFRSLVGAGTTRKIMGFRGINLPGSWSPDGKKLLITLSIDGNEEIYSMNIDDLQLTRLTNHFAIDVSPCYSPDGKQIAFVSNRAGSPQIYVMNADGSNIRRLTFDGNYNTSPSWSPKGGKIAYEGMTGGRFQIFVVDEDGFNPIQLTQVGENESPTWSPDGKYIAFTSKKDGKAGIVVMNANGTNQRILYDGTDNYLSPSWSPRLK